MRYFWLALVLVVAAAVAFSIFYYSRYMKKKTPFHKQYLWVGEGEHPFRDAKPKR